MSLKKKNAVPVSWFLVEPPSSGGFFVQEGPAFRCPESVALAADFEREGAAVFWVEAWGVGRRGVGGWFGGWL